MIILTILSAEFLSQRSRILAFFSYHLEFQVLFPKLFGNCSKTMICTDFYFYWSFGTRSSCYALNSQVCSFFQYPATISYYQFRLAEQAILEYVFSAIYLRISFFFSLASLNVLKYPILTLYQIPSRFGKFASTTNTFSPIALNL
jgi:hypothetical protein